MRARSSLSNGLAAAALGLLAGCARPAPAREEPRSGLAAPDEGPPRGTPREDRAPAETAPGLPWRALDLACHGRPEEAAALIERELHLRLRSAAWDGATSQAESVVAALLLEALTSQHERWSRAERALAALEPHPPATPPELSFRLRRLRAECLRATGRPEEARAITRDLGYAADWRVCGPFASERGAGFDVAEPPEQEVDLAAVHRGKEREVRWRENPCPEHPLGRIVLSEMLRPSRQVQAYAATAVRALEPGEVCLRIGCTGALKVFVNGREVLARKLRRPLHADQDRAVLRLAPGWNQILLKLGCEDEPAWAFEARFTDLAGRAAARLVEVDSSRCGPPAALFAAAEGSAAPEAQGILEASAGPSAGGSAEAARLAALYHLLVHPDDVAERTARKWAERALALEPPEASGAGAARAHFLLAWASAPEAGETTEELRLNEQIAPLKEAVARDPGHVAALLGLADVYSLLNPIPARADEYTARALEAAPASERALWARSEFLESRGRGAEARALVQRAWEREGPRAARLSLALAEDLAARGEVEEATAILQRAFDGAVVEGPLAERLIEGYVARGKPAEARGVLERLLAAGPFLVGRTLETARLLEHAGELGPARSLVERVLRICPENLAALQARARLNLRAGDAEAAIADLEEALRVEPGYDKARRQIALLQSQGQERFEEPFRWDARELASSPPSSADGDDPLEVVKRTVVWRVNRDGTEHSYEHILLRALSLGGVKELDSYAIPYPQGSSLRVYEARVIHADGRLERAPDSRTHAGGEGWSFRWLDLPPLEPGDLVDLEYRVDQRESDVFGPYFGLRHEFYPDRPDPLAPTATSELVVLAPEDVPLFVAARNAAGLETTVERGASGLVVRRWVARDLRRPPLESAMPARSEIAPVVDVSTYASWDAFARWWWSFIEKEFVTTQAMKDEVRDLIADLSTEEEKVRAIARFVGQEVRYNSWPFGTHGYEPFSAATIFERRFGDCKDKSILLRQMLAEIGVEAHPVLIQAEYARPDEPLEAAMVEHFNHCIAYLPPTPARAGYYLDATADRNPLEYLRADDQGARVLHVRDGRGEIRAIPYAPPEANALRRAWEVDLAADGSGEVTLLDTSSGAWGVELRQRFGGEQGDLEKRLAQSLAQAFGRVDVRSARTSDLEDIGVPAELSARFAAAGLWSTDASGAQLRLSFDPIDLARAAVEPAEARRWDVVLDRPFAQETRVVYSLPSGARLRELPPDAEVRAPGLLEYEARIRDLGGKVEVRRRFALLQRRIERVRYADFQEAVREIQLAEVRTIAIDPPPAPEGGGR